MGRKNKAVQKDQTRKRKRLIDIEIKQLEERIIATSPAAGTNPIANDNPTSDPQPDKLDQEGKKEKSTTIRKFEQLPISKPTMKGLQQANFIKMTSIQRASIPHALCGRDILAAAKTGSGKTLAFIVPMLEKLFRSRWCRSDGLGAVIISPTRELALQIFDVLRKVGQFHNFSAGLVVGGKDQKAEEERIGHMNILVCTPGRLLHHLDVSVELDTVNLQMLILDEADRILDLGFERSMTAILANFPKKRQTVLFSATQTKSVKSLARLSLNEPEYISVHEDSEHSTPMKLQQSVLFCPLEDKINTIWSFLRTHTNEKSIIFFSSCKQVRFVFEAFRFLSPGCPLSSLHGKVKQMKRFETYKSFCAREGGCAMFATDLAARGLDFANVDWVIQADCPDSTDTYIHRVGRTARYRKKGKALLILLPSEKHMLELLESRKIPLNQIKVNPKRNQDIQNLLLSLNSQNPEVKYLAQKSFVSYVRSIHLNSNKDVFSTADLPLKEYAESLGLIGTPRIRFIQNIRKDKNIPAAVAKAKAELQERKKDKEDEDDVSDYESDSEEENGAVKAVRTKAEKLRSRVNQGTMAEHYTNMIIEEEESEDDLLEPKRLDHEIVDEEVAPVILSKRKKRRLMRENVSGLNTRVLFDDDGNELNQIDASLSALPERPEITHEEYITSIRAELKDSDRADYLRAKNIRKEKKEKQKAKDKRNAMEDAGFEPIVTIGPFEGEEGYDDFGHSADEFESGSEGQSDEDDGSRKRYRNESDDSSSPERKKQKTYHSDSSADSEEDLEDLEARALRILERSGL